MAGKHNLMNAKGIHGDYRSYLNTNAAFEMG